MEIKARMPGKLEEVKVKKGDVIKKGDVVAVMEAMKMKAPMPSPVDGVIREIAKESGMRVNAGDLIMIIDET